MVNKRLIRASLVHPPRLKSAMPANALLPRARSKGVYQVALSDELVRYSLRPLAFRIRQPGRLFADLSQPQVVLPCGTRVIGPL
jgi:hypothetical protein